MRPLLTPADIRRLLDRHGLAPRKAHGQNFVVDPNTVRKVVRDARVAEGDLVCEIGPGLGSLTLALREAGARVVAVEVDAGLVGALREVVGEDPGVEIHHADALRADLAALVGAGPALLVANLPYKQATALVLRALDAEVFTRLHVMVQREVAQRWVAAPGRIHYGGVSVKIAARAEARVAATVSRSAFYPVPNVDSLTVTLVPRPWPYRPDRDAVLALVEQGFAHRRKRLRNALSARRPLGGQEQSAAEEGDATSPAQAVEAALARAGLSPGARAEELDLPAWVALYEALEGGK